MSKKKNWQLVSIYSGSHANSRHQASPASTIQFCSRTCLLSWVVSEKGKLDFTAFIRMTLNQIIFLIASPPTDITADTVI